MKKKIFAVILAAAMAAGTLAFAGCRDNTDPDREVTLNVWTVAPLVYNYSNALKLNPNDKQAKLTKWIVETFEAENKNIKLNLQYKGWGEPLNAELVKGLNLKGDSAPDIVIGEQYVRNFIEDNRFLALDLGAELEADVIDQAKNIITKDGKLYAVPITSGIYGLNVNLEILRNAGILDAQNAVRADWRGRMSAYAARVEAMDDAYSVTAAASLDPLSPATWEDLLAVSLYLRDYFDGKVEVDGEAYAGADGSSRGAMVMTKSASDSNWQALPYMRTAGGDFVDASGTVAVGSDENLMAFEMMRRLSETAGTGGIISASEDMNTQFFMGYGAYCVQGAELVTRAYNYSQYIDEDDVAATYLPVFSSVNKKTNTMVGSIFMSINKNKSGQSAQALKFIKFLLSDEVQYRFMTMDGRIPVKKSILSGEAVKEQENYEKIKPFVEMYSTWDFDGMLYGFPNNADQVWTAWNVFVSKLFNPGEDLVGALATAQADMKYYAERK